MNTPGEALPGPVRSEFETGFGFDFSSVRIHRDDAAARSAATVGARAYTVGNHVVFGAQRFEPYHPEGRQLLAHELVHTLQQSGAGAATGTGLPVAEHATGHEVEADRIAARFLGGHVLGGHAPVRVPQLALVGPAIQRQAADDPPAVAQSDPAPAPGVTPPPPAPPWISRIDVRASAIAQTGPLPIYHAFVVHYNSKTKEETFTRGGHTKDAPATICPGVGKPKGTLFGDCPFDDPSYRAVGVGPVNAKYGPGTVDWPAVTSSTLLSGPDADTKDGCFVTEADRISKACIAYSPCGPNSNSVAYTLLTNCGVPNPHPPGGFFPGWGTLL